MCGIFTLKQEGEKAQEKKHRVYVGFMDLEKAYDRFNREALWCAMKMFDVEGSVYEVSVNWRQLEYVSEFKYLGSELQDSGIYGGRLLQI